MLKLVKDPVNDDAWTEVEADSDRSAVIDYLDKTGMGPPDCAVSAFIILVADGVDDPSARSFTVRPVPARWDIR